MEFIKPDKQLTVKDDQAEPEVGVKCVISLLNIYHKTQY